MALNTDARPWAQATLLGALAGLAGWLFWDVLGDGISDPRLFMLLAAATYGAFFMLLALVGPARLPPSLPWAVGVSAFAAGLLFWASFRYASVDTFLSAGYPLAAFLSVLVIATPFVAARLLEPDRRLSYPALFELSWRIFVRYLAAVLFTGLFWGLLGLSDALLKLVGLHLMNWIWAADPLAWVLTGAVFGLALSVVHELREYLSPFVVLRLLRLLLPVVLIVVVVFLAALPVQGLSDLTGTLSAAGTMMTAALAAVALITVAVDRDGAAEEKQPWLRAMVQALALLVPVLAGLAIYALWLRVAAYGWTPERLMAATAALVALLYGLAYGGAVALRRDWAARIRRANIAIALATLGLAVIWLSPLLVPERIAARDQLARYETGRLPPAELPLSEMADRWGFAGAAALAVLGEDPALADRIAAYGTGSPFGGAGLRADLAARLPVTGAPALDADQLADISDDTLDAWAQACGFALAGGPGCALVFGDFQPGRREPAGLLLLRSTQDRASVTSLRLVDGRLQIRGDATDLNQGTAPDLPVSVLEAVHAGTARIEPPAINALIVGDHALFPLD